MQFRIAAGQPAAIGALGRRFVGERREGNDLGAGMAPGADEVRVGEGKSPIAGERDALSRRRHRRQAGCVGGDRERRRGGGDAVEIEMSFRHGGEPLDEPVQVGMLTGLHQAEMTLRQSERRLARDGAEHGNAERVDGVGDQRAVPLAGDAIENDAGDAHGGIVRRKSAHQGGSRLRLPRHVEHQHHWQIKMRGKIGGGAAPAAGAGRAVEQSHHAFDDKNIRVARRLRGQGVEQRCRHRPGIEIDARRADGGGVESRIDIIRPGFGRAHGNAAPRERRQDSERDSGLAGAGMRRGDDEPARRHGTRLSARRCGLRRSARGAWSRCRQ